MIWSIIALERLGYADDIARAARTASSSWTALIIEETRTPPGCSRASRRCGTRRSRCARWPTSGLPADHDPVETAASTGCSTTRVTPPGDWSKTVEVPSPAAGASSTPTSSIPTSTTRRWSRWRWQTQFSDGLRDAVRSLPPSLQIFSDRAEQRPPASRHARRPARPRPGRYRAARKTGCWPCRTATAAGAPSTATTTAEFLCHVPFADHNAMIDPSTPDLTARVLEALGCLGKRARRSGRRSRASTYLRRTQEARRQLVRPLGRQLHLRHLAGARRA